MGGTGQAPPPPSCLGAREVTGEPEKCDLKVVSVVIAMLVSVAVSVTVTSTLRVVREVTSWVAMNDVKGTLEV